MAQLNYIQACEGGNVWLSVSRFGRDNCPALHHLGAQADVDFWGKISIHGFR